MSVPRPEVLYLYDVSTTKDGSTYRIKVAALDMDQAWAIFKEYIYNKYGVSVNSYTMAPLGQQVIAYV